MDSINYNLMGTVFEDVYKRQVEILKGFLKLLGVTIS